MHILILLSVCCLAPVQSGLCAEICSEQETIFQYCSRNVRLLLSRCSLPLVAGPAHEEKCRIVNIEDSHIYTSKSIPAAGIAMHLSDLRRLASLGLICYAIIRVIRFRNNGKGDLSLGMNMMSKARCRFCSNTAMQIQA